METKPLKIKLIGKKGKSYQIKFPYLKIPVTVNENLFNKMLLSTDFELYNDSSSIKKAYPIHS
ncbi:hypothetical protein [Aestuariibaculum sediminum]|uniref:Uncharacterized protein n=1 Tax=Aestuariibaculum sediminum TaxID=2770637 RepID=A0A8J6U8G7_9FLAO|nr:hypothetical protein [Aestuariibaculum sediminum]MBD0831527.1 hypothetical protein [Aestuariibaculum sediminum]